MGHFIGNCWCASLLLAEVNERSKVFLKILYLILLIDKNLNPDVKFKVL